MRGIEKVADEIDIDDLQRRMNGAVEVLRHEFAGLRTGRASASLLEPITVDVYGAQMPLNQVGTISVPEPRMISVQVWDKTAVTSVEKAVRDSGLGLNPVVDGQLVRVPIPELTEERRIELSKVAHKYTEQSKVAVRNVRRDGMETLKKMEKNAQAVLNNALGSHDGELSKHLLFLILMSFQRETERSPHLWRIAGWPGPC